MKRLKILVLLLGIVLLISCSHDDSSKTSSKTFTVTFDTDGGTEIEAQTVNYGDTLEKPLLTPQKEGYTFKGWYCTDSKDKETEYEFSIAVTADLTIKAKYSANTYTVYFDKNGAVGNAGTMPALTCYYDQEYTLSQNTFTCIGKTFAGWTSTATSEKSEYKNNDKIKNLSAKDGDSITLYAVWNENPYHVISYMLNDSTTDRREKYKETEDIVLITPERTSYIFGGWFKEQDFSGREIKGWSAGEYTQDITLWAKWVPKTYTVTLNDRGQDLQPYEIDFDSFLNDFDYEAAIGSDTGIFFGGFYDQPYGKGKQYIDASGKGQHFDIDDNLTVYALWFYEISYDLTSYYTDGANPNSTRYTGERDFVLADIICKDGYEFLGWVDEYGDDVTKIPQGSTGTKSFTSKGTKLSEYTITFVKNGGEWNTSEGGYNPPETYTYLSSEIRLPTNDEILRDGFELKGWYKNEDFSGSKIETIEKNSFGNLVFYAKWQEIDNRN